MNRHPAGRVSVVAAIMVGAGALLSGFVGFLFLLWGVPNVPRVFFLQDPIGFALRPNVQPVALVAMLIAVLVLTGLTWLFVRMVARGALPGRGAAVFFGTWGAVIVAAAIAGILRAPLVLIALRIPADQPDLAMTQFYQIATAGVSWALTWGWLVALVAALIHRAAQAPLSSGIDPYTAGDAHPSAQTHAYPSQAPQTGAPYPPQPPHVG